ncbi:hypothetical protein HNR71_002013 [Kribbella sandramycini]|uniref:Uncharacterized protein n=1 Tax=Kribbella sandramycini TaxID=60450 RepID=A0A841SE18_9ACTN|nr:hypothetical protein [Kribbella sandramycini]
MTIHRLMTALATEQSRTEALVETINPTDDRSDAAAEQ